MVLVTGATICSENFKRPEALTPPWKAAIMDAGNFGRSSSQETAGDGDESVGTLAVNRVWRWFSVKDAAMGDLRLQVFPLNELNKGSVFGRIHFTCVSVVAPPPKTNPPKNGKSPFDWSLDRANYFGILKNCPYWHHKVHYLAKLSLRTPPTPATKHLFQWEVVNRVLIIPETCMSQCVIHHTRLHLAANCCTFLSTLWKIAFCLLVSSSVID